MPTSVVDLAPSWLTFHRAVDWGVKWKRPPVSERQNDPETYIHHGAGGRYGTDPIAAMQQLQRWYHDYKNYSTIGYDIMVHRNTSDQTVAILGAREGWMSAATHDRNDQGEAICLFGYFHPGSTLSQHPTDREIEALAFAVAWSIENGWSAPGTRVLGHRDNPAHPGATGCPGDYLYPHVPAIGRRAQQIIAQTNQPKDDDMTPLPEPRRIYDSRKSQPLTFGETRTVTVGFTSQAFVNVTAIGVDGTEGYISVNDTDGGTAVIGYSSDDRLESNGVPVATPNGQISVTNIGGRAHVVIDVFAQK